MRRIPLWIGAALVLAAPLGADQLEVPPYTAVPPCIDLAGGPTVGTVVAMNGPVTISAPGCAPVAAECGSVLHAGQQLGTGAGAQAAVAAGGQYVQVAGDSQVTIGATDAGATRVVVDRGSARVIDVGTASSPGVEVATPALETRDPGADVVASASEKGSSICSWADPIEVRQGGATSSVAAGDCATTPGFTPIAGPIGDTTGATVAAIPISIGGVGHCGVAVGDPGPPQVAAGPPGSTVPGPPPIIPPPYCVGGSCTGNTPPPPPPCCPGGIVEQPVIFEPPPD